MPTPHSTNIEQERAWIAGLQAEQLDVFRTVFETYQPMLCHFARVWVSQAVADDIVQDVMFDLWQRRQNLDAQSGNLTGYLLAAVRNRAMNYRRHQRVMDRVEDGQGTQAPPGMATPALAVDAQVVADDLSMNIERLLLTLPEMQRAVLMLRWTQHMSYPDIAKTLGISVEAARQQASRARKVLLPHLATFLDEIAD